MGAEIHQLRTKPATINWMCSACGVDAGCNCGAPLMSKAQRAAEALKASPEKSDRAIAKEIGVSHPTVAKAREATGNNLPVDEPRIGLDGKQRRMPTRREIAEPDDDVVEEATPAERRDSFLLFANEAMAWAKYDGPVDERVLSAAIATKEAWCRLVAQLAGEMK